MDHKSERALPRGPHDLTREEVESSQRRRLIAAMTKVVSERGYARTSVAEVIKEAGVSRATFYVLFRDKEQCFIEGLEAATDEIGAAMLMAIMENEEIGTETDVLRKIDAVVRMYLHVLSTYADVAKTFLVEIYAVGPDAVHFRRSFMDRFHDLISTSILPEDQMTPEREYAISTLVHAMSSMVTLAIGSGEPETLPAMREPFMKFVAQILSTELFENVL